MSSRPRIPILCGAMGPAACELKARTRLRAYDPGLVYVLHARELRGYARGTLVVDLTYVPRPTTAEAWRLRDMMEERGMVPVPLTELYTVLKAWHVANGTGTAFGFTPDPGP